MHSRTGWGGAEVPAVDQPAARKLFARIWDPGRTVHRVHTSIPIEIDPETGFWRNGTGFSVSSTNIAVCMLIIHGKIIYFMWP